MWSKKDTNLSKKKAEGIDYIEIEGDEGAPVIMLLHGFGADYEDLISLSASYTGKGKPRWIFPNGPKKVQIGLFSTGRSWFDLDIQMLQMAFEAGDYEAIQDAFPDELTEIRKQMEGFLAELDIAPRNLILGGFSMGAVLAIELALHAFERPLGLLVFSGTLVNRESWAHLARQKAPMPFLQTHGMQDPLLPLELAQQLESLFLEAGLKGGLHSFEGGHEIGQSSLKEFDHFLQRLF